MASFQELSEGFETITSQRLFEEMRKYFSADNVEEHMNLLAERHTVRIYVGMAGFQIDWAGTGDHYTVL